MCVCVRERERERTGIVETTSGRSDAGLAGAEFIVQVEQAVLAQGGIDTVGTVGQLEVEPGATNSIPRKVKLSLDLRDINGTRRDLILDRSACVLFTPDRISFRFFSFLFFSFLLSVLVLLAYTDSNRSESLLDAMQSRRSRIGYCDKATLLLRAQASGTRPPCGV